MDAKSYPAASSLAVQSLEHFTQHGPLEGQVHVEDRARREIRVARVLPYKAHCREVEATDTALRVSTMARVPFDPTARAPVSNETSIGTVPRPDPTSTKTSRSVGRICWISTRMSLAGVGW